MGTKSLKLPFTAGCYHLEPTVSQPTISSVNRQGSGSPGFIFLGTFPVNMTRMKPRQANDIKKLKHPCPLALRAPEEWHTTELTTSPPPVWRPPTWLPITRLPPRQVIRLVEDPDLPCGQYAVLRDVLDLVEQPDDCARRTPSSGGCGAPSTMAASRSIARRGMSTT